MSSSPETPIELEFDNLKIGTEPKTREIADLSDDAIRMIIENLGPNNLRKLRRKMAMVLHDDPIALRRCIIYHVFCLKQSAEKSYESLSEIVRHDVITREDVNAWFQQFSDSIRESVEQYRLLRLEVSRGLATLVDQKNLKSIAVWCRGDYTQLKFNDFRVVYTSEKCETSRFMWDEDYHGAKILRNENWFNMALNDLKFAIRDPALKLDVLNIKFYGCHCEEEFLIENYDHIEDFCVKFEQILKSFDHKISTKKFETHAECLVTTLMILPYLEPGTLQQIEFREKKAGPFGSAEEADQIASLEQWKQATELSTGDAFRIWEKRKHLSHFKRFDIYEKFIGWQSLVAWKNFCQRSENFEYCEFKTLDAIRGNFRFDFGPLIFKGADGVEIIHNSIPNDPNHFLEIRIHPDRHSVVFTKLVRPIEIFL